MQAKGQFSRSPLVRLKDVRFKTGKSSGESSDMHYGAQLFPLTSFDILLLVRKSRKTNECVSTDDWRRGWRRREPLNVTDTRRWPPGRRNQICEKPKGCAAALTCSGKFSGPSAAQWRRVWAPGRTHQTVPMRKYRAVPCARRSLSFSFSLSAIAVCILT